MTGIKKPEGVSNKAKATPRPKTTATATKSNVASKPKATAKSKTTSISKSTAKSKAVSKPTAATKAKTTTSKAAARPKTTAANAITTTKTNVVAKVPAARKIGEMVYNDELFEALSEIILQGGAIDLAVAMPEIKKQLFDYDIYMVSFLNDQEIGNIVKGLAESCRVDAKDLTDLLLALRDSAKVFVDIASKHNSVRAYIDRAIELDGKVAGISHIKESFSGGSYCIRNLDSISCESFLALF